MLAGRVVVLEQIAHTAVGVVAIVQALRPVIGLVKVAAAVTGKEFIEQGLIRLLDVIVNHRSARPIEEQVDITPMEIR